MAKNPSSESIDETAFQALEDALKINFNDDQSRPRSVPHASEARVSDTNKPRQTQYQDDAAESYRSAATETAAKSPTFQPANDAGKRSSTAILRTLEGGAMRSSIRNAVIVSILWAIGGIALGQMIYGNQLWQITSVEGVLAAPGIVALAVCILIPIMLFFAFAIMMARAQDLRTAARSMAEVALRLSDPETVASERDHECRPGRAPRSLGNERRHRAHHRPRRRARDARPFGSECAGAELHRQRIARSRPRPRTRRRTRRDRQPRRAHPLVDRRSP
nr:hypothetical protein [Neorhizobium galegae]